jgi:histidine ammonia-lyase
MGMAELGSISERRTYKLLCGERNLPDFLVANPGLHSGLMIVQYTAASLVSQNKQLCTPASVDSITSSRGQEDHVSMGANSATKLYEVVENVHDILAIELLSAAQAIEFQRPARSAPSIERMLGELRQQVPFSDADRVLHDEMQICRSFIGRHHPNDFLD